MLLLLRNSEKTKKSRFRHQSEAAALVFLTERCGHIGIDHNYKTPWGEIDLITMDEKPVLHSVEVKNWQSSFLLRHPLEFFSNSRIKRYQNTLLHFLEDSAAKSTIESALLSFNCSLSLYEIPLSFDLIWLRNERYIEYYPRLF